MKQINKKFYLIVVILVIVGISFVTVGLLSGASTSIYVDGKGIHLGRVKQDPYEETYSYKKIENLELETAFSNVEIIKSDRNEVKITGNVKANKPEIELRQDTLRITSPSQRNFFIGLFNQIDSETEIIIYVKEDLNTCELDVSYSSLKLKKINSKELKIDTSFSSVNLDGEYEKIKVNNSFGDVKGSVSNVNELKLENDFGDITLGVIGSIKDYYFKYESAFGDIKINGRDIEKLKKPYGDKTIKLNNSFGDIHLEF